MGDGNVIRVRFAQRDDTARVIEFIRDHWSRTHVFVDRPDVFEWQHQQADGRLNAVLAESDDEPGTPVVGLLGFIPTGRFDPALADRDVALAIWKVREHGVPPGLGLRLLKFLHSELKPRLVMAIGISDIVVPIYKVLRYEVGTMGHAALFHPGRGGDVVVASGVPARAFVPVDRASAVDLVVVDREAPSAMRDAIDRLAGEGLPAKSMRYVGERYLAHPWYRYEVRAVVHASRVVAVVVWRAVEARGRRVLRIVDIIGEVDWLPHGGERLRQEVVTANAEYIDLVHWGVPSELLDAAGFVSTASEPDLVLPNYFSPFERRNIEIGASARAVDAGLPLRMFRADSDQDRPNRSAELTSD